MGAKSLHGDLRSLGDGRRVGGGLCAIAQRGERLQGSCIFQRVATKPTPIDTAAPHRLVLSDGRSLAVRITKHSVSACGPEIVRFEGIA